MLLDHFHPPLRGRRHGEGFHHQWACNLAADLNGRLPPGWLAEPNIRFGIETDVTALATDVIEVQVFRDEGGLALAGAIELVSPANKDRPEARETFVSKCETYLREVVGLVVVDIVTIWRASLHGELLGRIAGPVAQEHEAIYAAAYRPVGRGEQTRLEVWHEALQVSGRLPSMPLYLRAGPCIEVDLASTYVASCRELRIAEPPGT